MGSNLPVNVTILRWRHRYKAYSPPWKLGNWSGLKLYLTHPRAMAGIRLVGLNWDETLRSLISAGYTCKLCRIKDGSLKRRLSWKSPHVPIAMIVKFWSSKASLIHCYTGNPAADIQLHTFVALPALSSAKNGLRRGAWGCELDEFHLMERAWAVVGQRTPARIDSAPSSGSPWSSLAIRPPTANDPDSLAIPCRAWTAMVIV